MGGMSDADSSLFRSQSSDLRDPRLRALAEESGYQIRERIGAGGMGIVYRAVDADGRDVAIKLLRHDIADDPRSRRRLAREVAAQRLVHSDSIVRILDAELDSSEAFIVTEFIPGPTLEEAVEQNGPLHPELVREIGVRLGAALQRIHEAGVVHRDLKPSNIMLRGAEAEALAGFDPEGDALDPVIIDFGIAQAAEESRLTSTGLVMGTAAYLDPEVVRADAPGPEGDWWSLGALLCFAATGRPPFGTGRADLVFLRAERGELDVEGLPTQLAAWLREGLRADPAERPDPVRWLGHLDELDLETYDDPGPTEAFASGQRTEALGAGATAALPAGATAVLPAAPDGGAAGTTPIEAGETRDRADSGSAPAEPSDHGSDRTEALASPVDRTEVLPAAHSRTEALSGSAGRTEALPAPADRTEALAVGLEPEGPPTERIERVNDPTLALPVVREPAPLYGQTGPQPLADGAPTQQAAPLQQPTAPQQTAPLQPTAPLQRPQGPVGAPMGSPYPVPMNAAPGRPYPGPMTAMPPGGMPSGAVPPGAMPPPWAPVEPPPPRRGVLVGLGHLLLLALGALAPYVALLLMVLVGAMARAWEGSHRAIRDRRLRGAQGSGPLWAAGIAWPFRALGGAIVIVLQAAFPALLGFGIGLAVDAALVLVQGYSPPDSVALGIAVAVTLFLTWVGLGSRTTRLGTHRMVDAAAPDRVWSLVVGVLLIALIAAVVAAVMTRQGSVDYFPFAGMWQLDDLAVWRR